jgi:hypothetical protein
VLAVVVAAATSSCGREDGDRYGPDQVRLKVSPSVKDVASPEAERYGAVDFLRFVNGDGPDGALERPTYVGYDSSSRSIVVAELSSCEIKFLDWKDGIISRKVGGCGEGPGELGFALGVDVSSDTIFVLEANTGFWKKLKSGEGEYGRYRLQDSVADFPGVAAFVGKADNLLAVISAAMIDTVDTSVESWGYHVAMISGDKFTTAPIRASSIAGTIVEGRGPYFRMSACMSPGFRMGDSGYVVVAQPLAFESVILGPDFTPIVSTFFEPGWRKSRLDSIAALFAGKPVPGGHEATVGERIYIVCGPSLYAIATRAFVGRDERVEDAYGMLEVRRYDGELVARRVWYGGVGGGQLGSPRAFVGDTLVTMTVDRSGELRLAAWTFGRERM